MSHMWKVFLQKKWLNSHFDQEHQSIDFNVLEKLSENDNKTKNEKVNIPPYENHFYIVIGPRNVGKTFYVLKILEKR